MGMLESKMFQKMTKFDVRPSRIGSSLKALTTRFRRDEDGVVALEFALVAPILVGLFLALVGLTESQWAKSKVDYSSSVVGSLIAQAVELDNAELTTLLSAVSPLMQPYTNATAEIQTVLTLGCLDDATDPTSNMTYYVVWSRKWDPSGGASGTGFAHGGTYANPPGDLKIAHNGHLIITDVTMNYTPVITYKDKLSSTYTLKETSYNAPRAAGPVTYTPVGDDNNLACP